MACSNATEPSSSPDISSAVSPHPTSLPNSPIPSKPSSINRDFRPSPISSVAMTSTVPCPVTIANGSQPPDKHYQAPTSHGNNSLWVILWPEGKVLITPDQVEPDGSLGMKFPWYRGVPGKLVIEGRRLDKSAPPLRANIPDGYGEIGFQSTGIYFPT
jgi:hypothetical protein